MHSSVSDFRLPAPLPAFHHELTLKVSVISDVIFTAVTGLGVPGEART